MTPPEPDVLKRLARESGERLGGLGVRAEDERWIQAHAETIASLARAGRRRRSPGAFLTFFYCLARKAARTAR